MKLNQVKVGSILSYAQMLLSVLIGLVYTPIMIRLLGKSEYGLYNTVASTISMLSILTLGFTNSYIRFYAGYKKDNNVESIYKLNGLFIIIFTVIGFIALLCGLFFSFNLELVFDQGLTASEYATARVLMILLTLNLASSFPMSVFSSIISANERFVFLKLLGMAKTVVGPLVTLPVLFAGYRSIAMVMVTLIVSLIVDVTYWLYIKFVLKEKFIFRGFERGLFKDIFGFTFFIALNLIVDQINWNIGKFLLGRYQGTAAVAIYSVGFSIYNYYMMFSSSVSGVFTPRIHHIVSRTVNDLKTRRIELTELFVKVGRIQFLILALLASGLIFFGRPFIFFWAGEGYEESYHVMLWLVLPATIPLIQNCGIEVQRAENKHQFRSIVYIVMAFVNLLITIFLAQRIGPVSGAIGTAFSIVLANGIIMNIYYHKKCDLDIKKFWKDIIKMCRGLVAPCLVGILITRYIDLHSIWNLLFAILLYSAVYCSSMWLVGMNEYEKGLIKDPLKKLGKKKNGTN